ERAAMEIAVAGHRSAMVTNRRRCDARRRRSDRNFGDFLAGEDRHDLVEEASQDLLAGVAQVLGIGARRGALTAATSGSPTMGSATRVPATWRRCSATFIRSSSAAVAAPREARPKLVRILRTRLLCRTCA